MGGPPVSLFKHLHLLAVPDLGAHRRKMLRQTLKPLRTVESGTARGRGVPCP